jgi:hypothetical protein
LRRFCREATKVLLPLFAPGEQAANRKGCLAGALKITLLSGKSGRCVHESLTFSYATTPFVGAHFDLLSVAY